VKEEDGQLYESMLSSGKEVGRITVISLKRNGSLLLGLPLQRDLAIVTLSLYQPQLWRGRLLRTVMRVLVSLGLHRYLSKIDIAIGNDGLINGLGKDVFHEGFGFLLGSSDSEARNLIGIYKKEGEYRVVKAGCGQAADIVRNECETMQKYATQVFGAIRCESSFEIKHGYAYVAKWIKGRSPRGSADNVRVFKLLSEWLGSGKCRTVSELACWISLQDVMDEKDANMFDELSQLEVISPVMHGDFAPWNIKMESGGEIKVLDWEHADFSGMPGWDWLHYNVQRMRLVKGMSAVGVVRQCRALMVEDAMSQYLDEAGVRGHEELLLGSYFYYTERVYNYPRKTLIAAWNASTGSGSEGEAV
jgi:hypothetical protein